MRVLLPFMLLCSACTTPSRGPDVDAIRKIMADQELAWDKGDIPGFMLGYSDTVCFIGSRGMTCGRDAVTANYLRNYPDQATMGDLAFGIQEVVPAGGDHAWVTGTWSLVRAADTLGGGFSLLWARERDGWRIVRDHTY
jgi:ketosteroid isomerase-like protein